MEGPLPARDIVQIPFPLTPHALTTAVRGWRVEGLDEEGQVSESLQLARVERAPRSGGEKDNPGGLAPTSLPPFVTVERTLELGLSGLAQTPVARRSPTGAAIVLEIPLLAGESVISEGVRVAKGKVQVNLGAEESELAWVSTLAPARAVGGAPAGDGARRVGGDLDREPGAAVARQLFRHPARSAGGGRRRAGPHLPAWPGEKVAIAITRPAGTGGQTLTVDKPSCSWTRHPFDRGEADGAAAVEPRRRTCVRAARRARRWNA